MSPTEVPIHYVAKFGDYYPAELADLFSESQESYQNAPERPEYPEKTVPEGWPSQHPASPMIWDSETFPTDDSHKLYLSKAEVAEIDTALKFIQDLSIPPSSISKSNFPLPTLGPRLEAACHSVHFGLGISIIIGIPSQTYTDEQNVLVFLGISSYVGETRGRQRDDGARLVHIFHALSQGYKDNQTPIFNNNTQVFHCDFVADILTMYCITPASSGGANSFASIPRIYNQLARYNPEIIHTLAAPDWVFDTYGYNPPWHTRPLLFYSPPEDQDRDAMVIDDDANDESDEEDEGERTPRASLLNLNEDATIEADEEENDAGNGIPKVGRIITSFSPYRLSITNKLNRKLKLPTLTPRQQIAVDEIEKLAKKYSITELLPSGSIVFVNNLAILHNRNEFTEDPSKPLDKMRHLMRMFLRNEELAWPTPRELWLDWGRTFGDFEGLNEERWAADMNRDYKSQRREAFTTDSAY
ncbi:hypothetical protein TWF694_003405 [Orbilia ellipsospora]|uniref:TauD/TfdA-like domain-containing protein n=1 Tax=Orbilia ellipsospora TaxID=2528407 RepID=A0AAV9X085_9PEZI